MAENGARLAVDRMLGRLARWLRLAGADVLYDPALDGAALLERARFEHRPLITRDKRLRTAPDVFYLAEQGFRDQLRTVAERFRLALVLRPLTRCPRCNQPLSEVGRAALLGRLPPFVWAAHERFARCSGCGKIFWQGTHAERILQELKALGLAPRSERGG
ncbi:MAG: Mut7-C RNAse domain-containing protein [Deltaproteobacteria bacterium]|nr:Mut7-C RNAse domain-containing protein [Deltaproteobacteria bacterium]